MLTVDALRGETEVRAGAVTLFLNPLANRGLLLRSPPVTRILGAVAPFA